MMIWLAPFVPFDWVMFTRQVSRSSCFHDVSPRGWKGGLWGDPWWYGEKNCGQRSRQCVDRVWQNQVKSYKESPLLNDHKQYTSMTHPFDSLVRSTTILIILPSLTFPVGRLMSNPFVRLPKDSLLNRYADIVDGVYTQKVKGLPVFHMIGQRLFTGRVAVAQVKTNNKYWSTMFKYKYFEVFAYIWLAVILIFDWFIQMFEYNYFEVFALSCVYMTYTCWPTTLITTLILVIVIYTRPHTYMSRFYTHNLTRGHINIWLVHTNVWLIGCVGVSQTHLWDDQRLHRQQDVLVTHWYHFDSRPFSYLIGPL